MPSSLYAISPVDGRYHTKTEFLKDYFSEYALIFYRVKVELAYLEELLQVLFPEKNIDFTILKKLEKDFSLSDAENIKTIEKTTNHDVKAVEYFIKEFNCHTTKEFIRFLCSCNPLGRQSYW